MGNPIRQASTRARRGVRRRAYTLVEVLIVVVILGIAAAMVVPSFSQTGVLRVQAAVRTVVSDITAVQSDALAYQRSRAILFYPGERRYRILDVKGSTIDPDLDMLEERVFTGESFGDSVIDSATFQTANTLIFDEIGSPIANPGSSTPASTGTVEITGSQQRYRVTIEAYTGRVTVKEIPL